MILVDSLYKWRDVVRHKSFVIEIQGLGVLCRAKKVVAVLYFATLRHTANSFLDAFYMPLRFDLQKVDSCERYCATI